MGKRLLSLLTALALAVSAFAGLTVAPAGAVVEELGTRIYFPSLPNGDEYGEMGPWYSAFTVQNPNNFTINVTVFKADGTQVTVAELQPFASKTWPASAVFGDGAGGGVYVVGPTAEQLGPRTVRYTVVRGTTEGGIDRIPNPCGTAGVQSVQVTQQDTQFLAETDYEYDDTDDPGLININWSPNGAEPDEGTTYTVTVTCAGTIQGGGVARIAGVAKIVAPVRSDNARTSAQHETVSGYTALPNFDVSDPTGLRRIVFPIVQTNNGWNSVLHVTNFDTRNNCGVTVTLYQTPSGYSDPSFGQFTRLLNRGQIWHLDLAAQGVPAGWVGQAWISSDCDVAATVDRVKPAQPWGDPVNMALTNQALLVDRGNTVQALPLIFQAYNGWNTGISIANLSLDEPATV
ncbi:MAG: DUF4815 domain-containing protein, partial [Dehalococcoidia bacterium]|nr:DUF4815 domain-containing protein [Dehalococcoidia bacterium]